MKKMLIYLLIVFVVLVIGILIIGRTFYPDNVAETASDGGKKNLKTRIYQTDLATAEKIVREIIPTLSTYGSNWKLTGESNSADKGKVIKAEIPVVVFTDDLEVYLMQTDGNVTVNAKSNSRVGKSDFGENARHVNKLLTALDEKLNK